MSGVIAGREPEDDIPQEGEDQATHGGGGERFVSHTHGCQ